MTPSLAAAVRSAPVLSMQSKVTWVRLVSLDGLVRHKKTTGQTLRHIQRFVRFSKLCKVWQTSWLLR